LLLFDYECELDSATVFLLLAMSYGTSSDRTANKIALCSALFAGAAYVGYTVAKRALWPTSGKRENSKREQLNDQGRIL